MAAAQASAVMYEKHIEPMREATLLRCFRFPPCVRPERNPGHDYFREFFGCLAVDYSPALLAQYRQYVAEWDEEHAKDNKYWSQVKCFDFWSSKRTLWTKLAPIALWWLEFPTSSIAAKRAISVMRAIDVPVRGALTWEHFSREVFFQVNQPLGSRLLDRAMAACKKK